MTFVQYFVFDLNFAGFFMSHVRSATSSGALKSAENQSDRIKELYQLRSHQQNLSWQKQWLSTDSRTKKRKLDVKP